MDSTTSNESAMQKHKDEMEKHLSRKLGGNTNLTKDQVDRIMDKFEHTPENCGRNEMNELLNKYCRNFNTTVHISMLLLSNTMVKVKSEDEGEIVLRNSNMRVNHNNPSKTASMEMINNMASNPLKIDKKNSNDRSSWGKDMEVYMTTWDKVRA